MAKSKFILGIASERIAKLFSLAEESSKKNETKLSNKYIKIAKELSSHYKVSIPKKLKIRVCKKCGEFQIPGVNSNVTVASSKSCVIYTCKKCGSQNKIFYKKTTSLQVSRATH